MVIFNTEYKSFEESNHGWTVDSNTLYYFPLFDNTDDIVEGGPSLSGGNISKGDIGYTMSGQINLSTGVSGSRFIAYWIKVTSGLGGSNYGNAFGFVEIGGMGYVMAHGQSNFRNKIQYGLSNGTWYTGTTGITQGTWYHLAYGVSSTEAYLYVNGVKTTISTNLAYRDDGAVTTLTNGMVNTTAEISDLILSSSDRESEIADYFNKTKSIYGVS